MPWIPNSDNKNWQTDSLGYYRSCWWWGEYWWWHWGGDQQPLLVQVLHGQLRLVHVLQWEHHHGLLQVLLLLANYFLLLAQYFLLLAKYFLLAKYLLLLAKYFLLLAKYFQWLSHPVLLQGHRYRGHAARLRLQCPLSRLSQGRGLWLGWVVIQRLLDYFFNHQCTMGK